VKPEKTAEWLSSSGELKVLSSVEAREYSLKLASDEICFDPVFGLEGLKGSRVVVLVPVKDLAEHRLDRASYVVLEGESAKISIN
jgi:hypothetical protein